MLDADSVSYLIRGTCPALDAVLVTNNTRHFSRIPALRVENWTTDSLAPGCQGRVVDRGLDGAGAIALAMPVAS